MAGFAIGMLAVPLLAFGLYGAALVVILANRVLDGVDGAVARERGVTDFGGYLDAVCDFIFYSAVVFGFALGNSDHAVYAAFLILCFMGTGSTFLSFAALAARRGLATEQRGKKSLYYLGGLTEGTETIAAFALFCLFPAWFPALALGFGALCGVTTITRIAVARQTLSADEGPGHERSDGPTRIGRVALLDGPGESCHVVVVDIHSALLFGPAERPLLETRREEHLEDGVGENDRADVPTVRDGTRRMVRHQLA